MTTQAHHLIPTNVIETDPLFKALKAAGHTFGGATLDLPDKGNAAAASLAGDVTDSAHTGRHLKAYDDLVRAYLAVFQREYIDDLGNNSYRIKVGVDVDDIFTDLKSL